MRRRVSPPKARTPAIVTSRGSHWKKWPYVTRLVNICASLQVSRPSQRRAARTASGEAPQSQTLRNPSCDREIGRGGTWGNGRPGPFHRNVLSEPREERQTHRHRLPATGGVCLATALLSAPHQGDRRCDYLSEREQGRLACSCGCPFGEHNEYGCKAHGMHEFRRTYAKRPKSGR